MIKQYFKQAWRILKENPVLSAISIIGTALAIGMIMVIVMSFQVKNAPYPPETKRDRMLYVKWMSSQQKGEPNKGTSSGGLSIALAKEGFKALKTPEAVSIVSAFSTPALASAPGVKRAESFDKMVTDEDFWRIFDFSFIDGKPYTKADVDAGLRKVVIAEKVARQVFGSTQVAGKTILLDYTDYTVAGVVKNVSILASAAYSQVWLPYTSEDIASGGNGVMGNYRIIMLAHSAADFPKIREEAELLRNKYNDGLPDWEAIYLGQPDTQFVYNIRKWASREPNTKEAVIQYIITLILLLIVPAINLSSMTGSHMRKRLSELGVRRSFGATRGNLLSQILWESLLQTFLGGILGLIFSFVAAYLFKGIIYMSGDSGYQLGETAIDFRTLFNPTVFVYAFLFCILLNILSAIIPAWRTSRKEIVEAIHSK